MIQVGGPYTPETLNEGKVNLGNPNNPVNATYSGGGTGTISDFIWTRSSGKIYPTNLTDRIGLGTSTFVGSERLRVLGETSTDTLRTANAYIDTARIRSGSYYANITATLTATRNLALPNASGTLALTSDIPLFSNAALLATYTNTNAAITNAISYSHQHSNYSTLNGITPTLVSNWNNAYSWGNHALAGYITAETDPIFVASAAYNITVTNVTNWNTAYGWGNHASAGYLTEEVDPIFTAHVAYDIDSTDITNWDTAYTDSHTHTNKTLLDSLISSGDGTNFLGDDGTYHLISTTVAGADTEIQFNNGGTAFGSDASFTFTTSNSTLNVGNLSLASTLYLGGSATYLSDVTGDLTFTDANAGSITLSDLVTGATNYWSTTTGGIYYGAGTDKVGINTSSLTEALTIDGNIAATDFNSSYFKYKNSNLLLGPNAGDNETGDNLLYISNSDTATPLVKGDFLNQMIEFNADTYINSVKRLCFGSSDVYLRRDGDDLTFSDLNTNSGNPVKLSDFVRDATLYALKSDFTQYSAVTSITNANKTTWNKSSVLVTTGSGDSFLADNGTYKAVSGGGSSTTLYLHDEISDISGYEKLLNSPANAAEDIETVAVTLGTSPVLIDDYVTDPNYPGITSIPGGLWTFKTWLAVDNATGTTTVTIRVYKRNTGGTETELFNVTTPEINSLTPIQYLIETVQPSYAIDATDRIVVKYYASTTTASSINVSLYYEGTAHYSFIITPISFASTVINDYIFKWDSSSSYYRPYTTKTEAGGALSAGKFYNGTDNPSANNRLNYDGSLATTALLTPFIFVNAGATGNSNGIQITGTNATGISVELTTSGTGVWAISRTGNALLASTGSSTSTANSSASIAKITKLTSGTYDNTGHLLELTDNPSTSGTISGALISGTVVTTERLRFDPRVVDGATAVASFEDTHTNLTTAGAKLKSFRMQGSEKAYIDKDGNIDTVGIFKINGVDVRSTLRLKQSTGLTYNPANPFLFDNDYQYNNYTLSADITPTYSLTGAIALNGVSITFVGDGTHTVDFSNFVESDLSGTFDITNGAENTVIFYYNGVDVFYSITSNVKLSSSTTTGVLSSTDWSTFNNKQAALVSGTNIKTINSTTILGSGDIAVQPTLVSGTNIKTINSTSLLGSGDITITAPTPTDNIFDWDGTNSWYAPYSSKQASVSFYTGTSNPSLTTRLNLDASFYATAVTSFNGEGIFSQSSTSAAIQGNSMGAVSAGIFSRGANTTSNSKVFQIAESNFNSTTSYISPLLELSRNIAGTGNITGNLIDIIDNPSTSGTTNYKLLSATIGSTERISLNPRVADGSSAVAYMFSTHNTLSDSAAKILSLKNNTTEVFYVSQNGTTHTRSTYAESSAAPGFYSYIDITNNEIVCNGTTRLNLNPNTSDGVSSVAYNFDTHNNLTTIGAKLASFKNQGVEKVSIDKDGSINSKGGLSLNFAQKSANYTLVSSDYCIECTTNSFIITLPTAVGISGKIYVVKNSGTGTITINTTSSQTIDGASSESLTQYDAFTFVSNGSNWLII